jgi:hypothetical protein
VEKSDLIGRIESARSSWDELLGRVDDRLALKPGTEGELSAKDLIAHVTWYEREVVSMLRSRTMDMSSLWALGPDERNAAIYEQARGMSLEDVRAESARVFHALIQQLELLPEEAYSDASRFSNMPPEWEPWKLIAGNTIWHYPDHTGSVRRLMETAGG